jgi:hypothetical protein
MEFILPPNLASGHNTILINGACYFKSGPTSQNTTILNSFSGISDCFAPECSSSSGRNVLFKSCVSNPGYPFPYFYIFSEDFFKGAGVDDEIPMLQSGLTTGLKLILPWGTYALSGYTGSPTTTTSGLGYIGITVSTDWIPWSSCYVPNYYNTVGTFLHGSGGMIPFTYTGCDADLCTTNLLYTYTFLKCSGNNFPDAENQLNIQFNPNNLTGDMLKTPSGCYYLARSLFRNAGETPEWGGVLTYNYISDKSMLSFVPSHSCADSGCYNNYVYIRSGFCCNSGAETFSNNYFSGNLSGLMTSNTNNCTIYYNIFYNSDTTDMCGGYNRSFPAKSQSICFYSDTGYKNIIAYGGIEAEGHCGISRFSGVAGILTPYRLYSPYISKLISQTGGNMILTGIPFPILGVSGSGIFKNEGSSLLNQSTGCWQTTLPSYIIIPTGLTSGVGTITISNGSGCFILSGTTNQIYTFSGAGIVTGVCNDTGIA